MYDPVALRRFQCVNINAVLKGKGRPSGGIVIGLSSVFTDWRVLETDNCLCVAGKSFLIICSYFHPLTSLSYVISEISEILNQLDCRLPMILAVEATLSCIPTECRQSENYVSLSRHVNCDLIYGKDINKAFVNLQYGFVEQSYETILNSLLDATIPCCPDNRNPHPPRIPILCELRSELVQIHKKLNRRDKTDMAKYATLKANYNKRIRKHIQEFHSRQ
ncbi:hypothetical protein GJ496_004995 [Pomphorhynchus laevis]|nr:hypothetical protein GJ496_004995 [Pomphorhynchus laevis]